jgi:trimethylamine:corrinoid methyltransferase-like protein
VQDDLWLDDALAHAGPGGSFLAEPSTRAGLHGGEWRLDEFGVSGSWDGWQAAGAPSSLDYARERVAGILTTHHPLPLPEDVSAALQDLERRARASS